MEEYDEIIDKAKERGYRLHNRTSDYSVYCFLKDDGIGLIVYTKTKEFEIYYNVDLVVSLKGGKCGSFMMDKHFNNQEKRITNYVYILKNNIR